MVRMRVLVSHYQTVLFKFKCYPVFKYNLIALDTAGCSQEVDPYYGINWPSTLINMEATNNCPDGAGTVPFIIHIT